MMAVLLWALLLTGAGAGLLALLDREVRPGPAEAFLAGAAWVPLALFLLSLGGLPLGLPMLLLVTVPLAGLASWRRAALVRIERGALPPLLLVGLCLFLVWARAAWQPDDAWDSRTHWGLVARLLYHERSVHLEVLRDPAFLLDHPRYPLGLPLLECSFFHLAGGTPDDAVRLLFPCFYLALGALVWRMAGREVPSPGRDVVLASAMALPGLVLSLDGGASSAYADVPLAALAALHVSYALRWLEDGSPGAARVAALAAVGMLFTKQQGIPFAAGSLALLVVLAPRGARGTLLLPAAAAAAVLAPWWAFQATLAPDGIGIDFLAQRLGREMGEGFRWENLRRIAALDLAPGGQWGLFAWASLLAAARAPRSRGAAYAALLCLGFAAVILAVLLPAQVEIFSAPTAVRLFFPLILPASYLLARGLR